MSRKFCSIENADEPLAGTAPGGIHTYLAIELSGGWESRAIQSEGVSEELRDALMAWQSEGARRVLFVRQSTPTSPTVWLSQNGELWSWALTSTSDLVSELASGPPPRATHHTASMLFVCTHGKRDLCCAKWGLPVYRAMVEDGRVPTRQVSHLGGHRFAATALVLPEGLLYGRLAPADAPTLAAHIIGGTLWLDRLRGRSALSMPSQAAEIALRQHLGNAVNCDVSASVDGEDVTVSLDGTDHELRVHSEDGPTTLVSCIGKMKASKRWIATV